MKTRTIISLAILVLLVSSCILTSLNPLYTEKDLRSDDRLIGKWLTDKDNKGKDYWIIEKLDTANIDGGFMGIPSEWSKFGTGKTYRLAAMEDTLEQEFALHLLELKGIQYLDFYPVGFEVSHGFLAWHMVPVHIFARVDITEDQLVLYFFNPDFFTQLIEQNKIRISHVRLDGKQLITAETDELQKFVKKYGKESQAYSEPDILPRVDL